ncbi:MAG: hypothetical protein LBM64_07265 [Deltaproteobacteria bacterium]|jgi:hypothetical protein|nr:hypothetical protein [Deltaproteobacteria bacterium]
MSYINGMQRSDYTLSYDGQAQGGVRIVNTDWQLKRDRDTLDFSEASLALAHDVAAMRDVAARQLSAAERYTAALSFGSDYCSTMVLDSSRESCAAKCATDIRDTVSGSFTTTSKQGTVIGVSNLLPQQDAGNAILNEVMALTVQITRQDGFQLNLPFAENMRVNDLADGSLAIYFAQSGLTKIYDTAGHETIFTGLTESSLGTGQDDIILNLNSVLVDGGDGDDIIINLAKQAAILGGSGNDRLIAPGKTEGLTLDGGAGDDTIAGLWLYKTNIAMHEGNDTLLAPYVTDSVIESSADSNIKSSWIKDSTLIATGENVSLQARLIHSLQAELNAAVNTINVKSISGSNISSGSGNTYIQGNSIYESNYSGGSGNSYLVFNDARHSNLNGGSGNDVFVVNKTYKSTMDGGGGDDLIAVRSLYKSKLFGGGGDDIIVVDKSQASSINGGDGDDTILAQFIKSTDIAGGSGNDTVVTSRFLADNGEAGTAMHRWYWNDENWIDNYLQPGGLEDAYARYRQASQELLLRAEEFDAQAEARFQLDKAKYEAEQASLARLSNSALSPNARALQYNGIVGGSFMENIVR